MMDRNAAALASLRCWKRLAVRLELDAALHYAERPESLEHWQYADRQRSHAWNRARQA